MIFFISDLHLSPRSPGATRLFLSFLAGRARQAEALYILGDLFEVWVGDDINDPYAAQITAALRAASDAGLKTYFMHGNRDFAIGEQFTAAAGMTLLPDPYDLVLPEWSFVLSHGDALCLDDHAYMAYRAKVRNPEWQRKMRAKPRFLRSAATSAGAAPGASAAKTMFMPILMARRLTISCATTAIAPSFTATRIDRKNTITSLMAFMSNAGFCRTGTRTGPKRWSGMASH